jgi:hypothetical protein
MTETTKIPESEVNSMKNLELSEVQQQAYDEAVKKLEDFVKEVESKKYLVDIDKKDIEKLRKFIVEDAKWKFMESLGIGEVSKDLATSVDKSGKVFINAVALEAIHYYLSKVEGTGKSVDSPSLGDIDSYLKILKAIIAARNSANLDVEMRKELEYIVTCRSEGLDPEDPEIKN